MALYHKWDVKNAYVLQFFPLISGSLGSVTHFMAQSISEKRGLVINEILVLLLQVSSSLTDYF
jgi:hypothetical protein